jgi:hypothetical protein
MTSLTGTSEARGLPEWINLGALATPEEISQREVLAVRGRELLPALAAWIRDAAPLAERPPLLEVVVDTREVIYLQMGITALAEVVDRFRELVAIFEASGGELDKRLSKLPAETASDDREETPANADLSIGGTDERHLPRDDRPISGPVAGTTQPPDGRWRRSRPSD